MVDAHSHSALQKMANGAGLYNWTKLPTGVDQPDLIHSCMHVIVTENYCLSVTVRGTRNLAMMKTVLRSLHSGGRIQK